MNMVIRTGDAVGQTDIGYADIGPLVLDLKKHAEDKGMKFVWYSPVPFCLFNPAAYGLGSPSCSAADGLLSIAPDGGVLPCSSFEQGVGNLLREEFRRRVESPLGQVLARKRIPAAGLPGVRVRRIVLRRVPAVLGRAKDIRRNRRPSATVNAVGRCALARQAARVRPGARASGSSSKRQAARQHA